MFKLGNSFFHVKALNTMTGMELSFKRAYGTFVKKYKICFDKKGYFKENNLLEILILKCSMPFLNVSKPIVPLITGQFLEVRIQRMFTHFCHQRFWKKKYLNKDKNVIFYYVQSVGISYYILITKIKLIS